MGAATLRPYFFKAATAGGKHVGGELGVVLLLVQSCLRAKRLLLKIPIEE